MEAVSILQEQYPLSDTEVADLVIWLLPAPMPGSEHLYKYRLAFICDGVCVLRFDNERGKGDHMHLGNKEFPIAFWSPVELVDDFWNEVHRWRTKHQKC